MPDPTPKLGLPKPRGNENDTRLNYIALIEAIDDAAAPASETVNQALAGIADAGLVAQLLSWLAGMIKAITGKADWKIGPATTLEGAATHIAAAAPHTGHAPSAKGVTNGDTHDHAGGDGAPIPAAALVAEAWTAITPSLYQAGTVACSTAAGRYQKFARHAVAQLHLVASAAGTAGNVIYVFGLPAAIVPLNQNNAVPLGIAFYYDNGTMHYVGVALSDASGGIAVYCDGINTPLGGVAPTIANTDVMHMNLSYETVS